MARMIASLKKSLSLSAIEPPCDVNLSRLLCQGVTYFSGSATALRSDLAQYRLQPLLERLLDAAAEAEGVDDLHRNEAVEERRERARERQDARCCHPGALHLLKEGFCRKQAGRRELRVVGDVAAVDRRIAMRLFPGKVPVARSHAGEPGARRLAPCAHTQRYFELVEYVDLHRFQQRIAVGEVFVERGRFHARALRNGADGERLRAVGIDQPAGERDELLARGLSGRRQRQPASWLCRPSPGAWPAR